MPGFVEGLRARLRQVYEIKRVFVGPVKALLPVRGAGTRAMDVIPKPEDRPGGLCRDDMVTLSFAQTLADAGC